MKQFRLPRREWTLFLLPFIILLFPYLAKLPVPEISAFKREWNRRVWGRDTRVSKLKQVALGYQMYVNNPNPAFPKASNSQTPIQNPSRDKVFRNGK